MNHNLPIAQSVEAELPPEDANVFALLADQARDHNRSGLWMTAVGGALNTALVWANFPGMHWLASAFAATAAYGVWGLADRERDLVRRDAPFAGLRYVALSTLRAASIPAGVIAALAAVAGFMAMALSGFGRFG